MLPGDNMFNKSHLLFSLPAQLHLMRQAQVMYDGPMDQPMTSYSSTLNSRQLLAQDSYSMGQTGMEMQQCLWHWWKEAW
jgi:hypothetical protein